MKKVIFLLLSIFFLVACSSRPNDNTESDTQEEDIIPTVELSNSIHNGYNSHLSYVDSGYEFASEGGLKFWYTLRNSDSIDYTEASITTRIDMDSSYTTSTCSLGLFKKTLKINETFTYYFYILKSKLKGISNIKINVSNTSCSNSDLDLFRINGVVESYNVTLTQEINKLNVYNIEAIFLTSNDFIAYTRNLIYCYADVIDTSGKLITSILLSGESETDHIENNQRIVMTAKFNMLKTSADRYAGVIFTSSLG